MAKYIWQCSDWPRLGWRAEEVAPPLAEASFRQGAFLGELESVGFELKSRAGFESVSREIVGSAAIEGERLDLGSVRSSVARRMEIVLRETNTVPADHGLEARVDMMLDATRGWRKPMTLKRLKAWHAALFPTGYSGLVKIAVGRLRDDREGPMRVISRRGMLERVHFEAPPSAALKTELADFLHWLEKDDPPALVKTAIAHLKFLTLHPFEDGNGRIARALTEYLLAGAEKSELRFYSLSAQIQKEKNAYYDELEHAQRGGTDVTRWVVWFLGLYRRALDSAKMSLDAILNKAKFWRLHAEDGFNAHQREMLNRLLDGFEGNLTSSKWAKICKVSQDTASREIRDLVDRGVLRQRGLGRSTYYAMP